MNALFDIIPAKYRRLVYSLATLGLFLYGLWEASQGDIKTFLISLASAIVTALASANTTPVGSEATPIVEDPEDDNDGDDTVADVLDPDFPEHDEGAVDAEYPNSETLYQSGEQPYERFGSQADFALTNTPEAEEVREGFRALGIPDASDDDDDVSGNDGLGGDPDPENQYFNEDGSRRY